LGLHVCRNFAEKRTFLCAFVAENGHFYVFLLPKNGHIRIYQYDLQKNRKNQGKITSAMFP